jgi:hypothetical protein
MMFFLSCVEKMWNPPSSRFLEPKFADQDFFTVEALIAKCRDIIFAEANGNFVRNLRRIPPMTIIGLPGRPASSYEMFLFEASDATADN